AVAERAGLHHERGAGRQGRGGLPRVHRPAREAGRARVGATSSIRGPSWPPRRACRRPSRRPSGLPCRCPPRPCRSSGRPSPSAPSARSRRASRGPAPQSLQSAAVRFVPLPSLLLLEARRGLVEGLLKLSVRVDEAVLHAVPRLRRGLAELVELLTRLRAL